jgi:hypothetical protein
MMMWDYRKESPEFRYKAAIEKLELENAELKNNRDNIKGAFTLRQYFKNIIKEVEYYGTEEVIYHETKSFADEFEEIIERKLKATERGMIAELVSALIKDLKAEQEGSEL